MNCQKLREQYNKEIQEFFHERSNGNQGAENAHIKRFWQGVEESNPPPGCKSVEAWLRGKAKQLSDLLGLDPPT